MILRSIRLILKDYAQHMTGSSVVVVLKILLEIFESENLELNTTVTALTHRYLLSMPCISLAIQTASDLGIFDVDKGSSLRAYTVITINKDFFDDNI